MYGSTPSRDRWMVLILSLVAAKKPCNSSPRNNQSRVKFGHCSATKNRLEIFILLFSSCQSLKHTRHALFSPTIRLSVHSLHNHFYIFHCQALRSFLTFCIQSFTCHFQLCSIDILLCWNQLYSAFNIRLYITLLYSSRVISH